MSSVSQFFGGASGPLLCEAVQFSSESPVNLTIDGKEFLRTGSIKTYAADYAPLIAAHSGLAVYGNDTKTKGDFAALTGGCTLYGYVAGKYIAYTNGAASSSDLTAWTVLTGNQGGVVAQSSNSPFISNGTYAVWPSASANTSLSWTSNGTSASQVGGDFSTNGKTYAHVVNDGSFWCAVAGTTGPAIGDIAYINAANPSGVWTISGQGIASTTITSVAAGNGYLVVATNLIDSATRKIFTSTYAAPDTVTDRSAALGIMEKSTTIQRLVFTGTYFVALLNNGKLYRATDPTGAWTYIGVAPAVVSSTIKTDRAGTLIMSDTSATFHVSRDHGSTWSRYQLYRGKAPWSTNVPAVFSFANGHWLANHSGSEHRNVIDLGAAFYDAAPDFVGSQTAFGPLAVGSSGNAIASPLHLRIK